MRIESVAALVLGALLVANAHGETSPYYLGANAGVSHDSNIFRSSDGAASDTTWSGGLLAGFDQPIGRQRVFANGSISDNHHMRFSDLDDVSYSVTAGADWTTRGRLSGNLRFATSSGLADYGVANGPQTTEKNILRTQQLTASAAWNLYSKWNVDTSFEHDSLAYSATSYLPLDSTQNVVGIGLRYGDDLGWKASIGGRVTRGITPYFQVEPGVLEPDYVHRQDVDLLALSYRSARSGVTARLSRSHETHTQDANPGFSGFTGAIVGDWAPSARLHVSLSVSRDTGTATTFLRFATASTNIDTNEVSNQLYGSINFQARPKINVSLVARYNRGDNSSEFGSSRDSIGSYVLQADYEPLRTVRLSCSVDREVRTSTTPGFNSRATVLGCTGALTVR